MDWKQKCGTGAKFVRIFVYINFAPCILREFAKLLNFTPQITAVFCVCFNEGTAWDVCTLRWAITKNARRH